MANKLIKNSGNGRYLVTKSFVTTSYTAWTVQLKIITEATLNACTLINTITTDQEVKCFKLDLNANGSLNLKINTGVSGDNWTSDQTSSVYLDTNTEYWLRIKYANTQDYTVEYSIDGITYSSTGILITSASPCYYTANQYINFIPSIDSTYFNGILDTSEVQIIYSSGGSDITLFNGSAASSTGIYNVGSTIINNIATFTSADTYIKCNGMMLGNNNISLISKIKIVSLPSGNEKQPIFVNVNGQGIYLILEDGYYKLSLKLSDSYSISLPINNDREFWIGYYYKNSIPYFGIIPYSYYSAFEGLPAFGDTQCTKGWNLQGQQGGGENWIKDCILIGADSNYYFEGEIDLSKTFLSNNLGSYNVNKIGYIPSTGTRLVDSDVSVSSVELTSMYKITIASQDSSGNPLDTDIKIDFTSIRNVYNNYYQRVSDTEVWVPAGSYLKNNKGVVIKDNVTQTETITTTLYNVKVQSVKSDDSIYTDSNIKIATGSIINTWNNYYKKVSDTEVYVPQGTSLSTDKGSLISNNVTQDIIKTIKFYNIKLKTVDSYNNDLTTEIKIDTSTVVNSYSNYFINVNDMEIYAPTGTTVYTNKHSLVVSDISSDTTTTITFYDVSIIPDTRIPISSSNITKNISTNNNYDNYSISTGTTGYEFYVPSGSTMTYTFSATNYITVSDTTGVITSNRSYLPRLKYKKTIKTNAEFTGYINLLSVTTTGTPSTDFKFTLHGSQGREYHYGGYAQATYTIPMSTTIQCRFIAGGFENFGIGAGIMINSSPLIFAGGSGINMPSGQYYGGGGYTGGSGSDGNGYSYNGSIGSSTAGNVNANGATNTSTYFGKTGYGGTGGTYSVSGINMVGSATLIANDSTHNTDPAYDPYGIYAYITIEEI